MATEGATIDSPSKVLEENSFAPSPVSAASSEETGEIEEKKPVHPLPRLFGWGKKSRSGDLSTVPTADAGTGVVQSDPTGALTPPASTTGEGTEEPFVLVHAMGADETPTAAAAAAVEGVVDMNAPEPGALVGGDLPSLGTDAPEPLVEEVSSVRWLT